MEAMANKKLSPTGEPTRQERKDLRVLGLFTAVYCRRHHAGEKSGLSARGLDASVLGLGQYRYCEECREFLAYALQRRLRCPLEPKPTCKECPVHCYRPGHRERVRQIMRFSGAYLIKRGRLDLLWHYFF
jgi:Nitrous oxide-stimulated promoter